MDHEHEREQLVGAAWAILERTDFAGLKVQRVASQAGLSTRAFYRHFTDKEHLLLVLVLNEMERAAERLKRTVELASDPTDKVVAWISAVIGAADDPRRIHRARLFAALTPTLRSDSNAIDRSTRLLWAPLQDAIMQGVDAGVFDSTDPARDAKLIHELAGARLRAALVDPGTEAVEIIIAATVGFSLRALGPCRIRDSPRGDNAAPP
jgi:AcrR family transcriptional regulator